MNAEILASPWFLEKLNSAMSPITNLSSKEFSSVVFLINLKAKSTFKD